MRVREKKGELTSSQIITIVIAIAGFIVILIFLALLYDEGTREDDRELCRLSILARATTPDIVQANVPLNCNTEKICISESGKRDACEQFVGEEDVFPVKLKGDDEDKKTKIEETLANSMYYCWSMTGQGKLDLFAKASEQFVGSTGESSCIICSRVAFAGDVNETILEQVSVDDYMREKKIPLPGSTQTYWDAFNNFESRSVDSYAGVQKSREAVDRLPEDSSIKLSTQNNNRHIAVVFAQVKTEDWQTVLRNLGGVAVGGTFVLPGAAKFGQALFLGPQAIITIPVAFAGSAGVGFNAYWGELAAVGYCGKYASSVEDKDPADVHGCSLVQVVNYNVQDVNTLCTGSIQSNP